MNVEEGRIKVPGGRVWYVRMGESGGKPLLVLHGGPGNTHGPLKSALGALSESRPVIFYDQLGSGYSDRPEDPSLWHTERFIEELVCVRDALNLDEFHLFGHSWGTMLAASYLTERRPAGVLSAIFSSPCLSARRWKEDADRYLQQLPEDERTTIAFHEEQGTTGSEAYQEAMKEYYRRHVCRLDPWPEVMAEARPLANKDIYLQMWGPSEFFPTGSLKTFDITDRLPEISVPSLFLCGRYDEASPESTRYYQSLVPNSEGHVFENSSHVAYLEETREYLRVVKDFLNKVEVTARE